MRILFVTRSLPFHRTGGMEAVSWDLARALARAGAQVTILTTAVSALPERSNRDGVDIHTLKVPSGRYSTAWWVRSRRMYEAEYVGRVDVVLSVSAGALSFPRSSASRDPIFLAQIHGTAWGEFKSKLRQRSIVSALKSLRNLAWMIRDLRYRRFDGLIAVGEAVHSDLNRAPTRLINGAVPVHVISNAVEPEQFAFDAGLRRAVRSSLNIADEHQVVLSCSRLHAQKGLIEGLEAFAIAFAKNPGLRYLIVGDGPDEARIRAKVKDLGLERSVSLLGVVPRQELKRVLSAADIFLFPTKRVEGLPMNVLEAMACGLPVIISDAAMDRRFEAVAVDPEDRIALAAKILEVQPSVARKSLLADEFVLANCAGDYQELMRQLLGHRVA